MDMTKELLVTMLRCDVGILMLVLKKIRLENIKKPRCDNFSRVYSLKKKTGQLVKKKN